MSIRTRGRKLAIRLLAPLIVLGALAVLAPGSGMSKIPPEDDGSRFTWPGAATMNVDVSPWGGGSVRSEPYRIDCPLACVRAWDKGREVTLTASPTSGFTFSHWEGACDGTSPVCKVTTTAGTVMDVTAVFTGRYVPPATSSPTAGPTLVAVASSGTCPQCFYYHVQGAGFHAGSAVSIDWDFQSPSGYSGTSSTTADANGAFSLTYYEDCQLSSPGPYSSTFSGAVVVDLTATDAQGSHASAHLAGGAATCP